MAFLYFFCSYVVALSVYRASNVWDQVQKQTPWATMVSAEVYRMVTSSFVWSWTISVNFSERIQDPEN